MSNMAIRYRPPSNKFQTELNSMSLWGFDGQASRIRLQKMYKKLKKLGFEFDRNARGSHEIWWNPKTRARTTIPNHPGDIPEGTMKAILKQAGVEVEIFLKK